MIELKNSLTQEDLKKVLKYDPLTGIFKRKTASQRSSIGDAVGCRNARGYVTITVLGELYKAHRLAWLYVHGYFPENFIDHIDRIKHHNEISNLREVSKSCNVRNTGLLCNNTSGVKGVNKNGATWNARICANSLGYFEDFDEAVCHRLAAEQCLDWSRCDSSSSAFKHVQKMLNNERSL